MGWNAYSDGVETSWGPPVGVRNDVVVVSPRRGKRGRTHGTLISKVS